MSASRGRRWTARWVTRAGLGEFNVGGAARGRRMMPQLPAWAGMPKSKGSRSCLCGNAGAGRRLLFHPEAGKLVAELLDAAAQRIDALLRAGVERMRLARGL